MTNFLKNYFGTLFFLAVGYIIYTGNDFHRDFISGTLSLNFIDFQVQIFTIFYIVLALYTILLIPFYIIYPSKSKGRIALNYFGNVMKGRLGYSEQERVAVLAWVVKLFFAPLMITWLSQHVFSLANNIYATTQSMELLSTDFLSFFNNNFFWMAFSLILFIDVFFFTMGYLLEAPFLKNTIKSVEPTLIGWAVAILCYPPFNDYVGNFIQWYSTDFPQFANDYVHIGMNLSILLLMGVYSWASFALGLKSSNLTNRGIVTTGPYAYIRHPAYICKNSAWIIGGLPMIYIALTSEGLSIFTVLLGLGGWTFLYYLRAMTEEIHLSADPDYIAYKKQVQYKFIPRVW